MHSIANVKEYYLEHGSKLSRGIQSVVQCRGKRRGRKGLKTVYDNKKAGYNNLYYALRNESGDDTDVPNVCRFKFHHTIFCRTGRSNHKKGSR